MMHAKSLVYIFSFETQICVLKNVMNMGNNLPDHIKVRKKCVTLELGEIFPVCNLHFVL